jgi:hypothetical protein
MWFRMARAEVAAGASVATTTRYRSSRTSSCVFNHVVSRTAPFPRRSLRLSPSFTRGYATSSLGFSCTTCGQPYAKWQGQCSACSTWGAIAPAQAASSPYRQSNAASFAKSKPTAPSHMAAWTSTRDAGATPAVRMKDVEVATFAERIALPDRELVRYCGWECIQEDDCINSDGGNAGRIGF